MSKPETASSEPAYIAIVSWREAFWTFARIAALSFGGPAGQIAVMHRILVEEKRWLGEQRFLHALNYCMLLPGPEAHQLIVYIGWLLHRVRGGLLAGLLFVLPGLLALGSLSAIYAAYGQVGGVQALFFGLKAAVLAVVVEAVFRVGKRTLKSRAQIAVAAIAFLALFLFAIPFPALILAAAAIGYMRRSDPGFALAGHHADGAPDTKPALIDAAFAHAKPAHVQPSFPRLVKTAILGLAVWLVPLGLFLALLGPQNVFTAIAAFNSKMAVVTFGGAYAVLAYMAQQAVETYHWLAPDEMLVGLGFAETTPGPLICVVQFVGFIAAFRDPGALPPLLAGTLGGLVAMWATFAPSFLWIFLGGPYVESLLGNKALSAMLSAITAGVVGVILNLSLWFALHTLFGQVNEVAFAGMVLQIPEFSTFDGAAAGLALVAALALFVFKLGVIRTLGLSCALGLLVYALQSWLIF